MLLTAEYRLRARALYHQRLAYRQRSMKQSLTSINSAMDCVPAPRVKDASLPAYTPTEKRRRPVMERLLLPKS
jgi:hypothetical protein